MNVDNEYRIALAETHKLLVAVRTHLERYSGMSFVPPMDIDARTPIGRVQFVEEAIRQCYGIAVSAVPAGRIGWDCQLHFLGPEGTRKTAS
jgi:hypothetical protein